MSSGEASDPAMRGHTGFNSELVIASVHPRILARTKAVLAAKRQDTLAIFDILIVRLGLILPIADQFSKVHDTVRSLRDELKTIDIEGPDAAPLMDRINKYMAEVEADLLEFARHSGP
jgi:hypothetical protein